MNGWFNRFLVAGLAVAVLGLGSLASEPAFADAVKDRQAAMKSISKANKTLRAAAKDGKAAEVEKQAKMIVALADKIPALFPKGTDRGTLGAKATRAKPEIWANWSDFQKKAGDLKSMAMQLASAAGKGDLSMAADGVNKACGGCHKAFRGPKAE